MRFCHSYWTKPSRLDPRNDRAAELPNISKRLLREPWIFALSLHYVKKYGHTLVMHTDAYGMQLFGFLPYDEVHVSLDEDLGVAQDLFYSAGKVQALKIEPVGTIHIDGDAFLKTSEIYQIIAAPGYDAVAQSLDVVMPNTLDFMEMLRPYLMRRMPWLFDNGLSYNSGVYGFRNAELRDGFIAAYEEITKYLSRSTALVERARSRGRELGPGRYCLGIDPLLFAYIKDRGYEARILWDGTPIAGIRPPHPFSDRYEHHAFYHKYHDDDFAALQQRLELENPGLYQLVREGLRENFADQPV